MYMEVIGIYNLDIISGKLLSPGYLIASWTDEQLIWNSTDFNGIEQFSVSATSIWVPSFVQFGADDGKIDVAPVWVCSNGTVVWLLGGLFEAFCKLDILHYPFDEHLCVFEIVPSTTTSSEIQLKTLSADRSSEVSIEHGEWEIKYSLSNTDTFTEPVSGTTFVIFSKTLKMSRRYMFVFVHTCIPLVLLTLLNMAVFVVPIHSGEKISFATSILLNFVFFTSSMSDHLPHNSLQLPYISILTATNNIITTFGVIISVLLCRMDSETIVPVPEKIKQIASKVLLSKIQRNMQNAAKKNISKLDDNEADRLSTAEVVLPEKQDDTVSVNIEITWSIVAEVLDKFMFYINLVDSVVIIAVFASLLLIK